MQRLLRESSVLGWRRFALLVLVGLLASVGMAVAGDEEGLPIRIETREVARFQLPAGWVISTSGDVLDLTHPVRREAFRLTAWRGQLDTEQVGAELLKSYMRSEPGPDSPTRDLYVEGKNDWDQASLAAMSEPEVIVDERLGPVTVATGEVTLQKSQRNTEFSVAVLQVNRGTMLALLVGPKGRTRARLDELLGAITRVGLPLDLDDYTGHQAISCGYEVDLPAGWRVLARDEFVLPAGRAPDVSLRFFIDRNGLYDRIACICQRDPEMPQVLDPAIDPLPAGLYRERTRKAAAGESYVLATTEGQSEIHMNTIGDTLALEEEGELSILDLEDREGYLWHVDGTHDNKRYHTAQAFTSWGSWRVDCSLTVPEGEQARLAPFDALVRSIRITKGTDAPQKETLRVWYKKRWPFQHALLQAPVLGGGLLVLLVGGVLILAFRRLT